MLCVTACHPSTTHPLATTQGRLAPSLGPCPVPGWPPSRERHGGIGAAVIHQHRGTQARPGPSPPPPCKLCKPADVQPCKRSRRGPRGDPAGRQRRYGCLVARPELGISPTYRDKGREKGSKCIKGAWSPAGLYMIKRVPHRTGVSVCNPAR